MYEVVVGAGRITRYDVHTSDNTPHHLLVLPRPILSNQV